ncbi:MAG: hypothetical protein GVY10_02720 [Verrucomicrobia bacterium]|nr:hypothetical protein [Verrucomicrobiota bacterium]
MNKTLLIIICDFLLISILALVEFKPETAPEEVDEAELREDASEEMLELLQLSLENETQQREELEQDLDSTKEELEEKESALAETAEKLQETSSSLENVQQSLEQTEEQRRRLAEMREELAQNLEQTRQRLDLTAEEKEQLARELQEKAERSRRLQEELQQRQAEAEAKAEALDEAEQRMASLQRRQQTLSTQLEVSETEKQLLRQNLTAAQAEVERARLEAERAAARSEDLAAGVSQLAASSTELKEEIRKAQPVSMNTIYKAFTENRLRLQFRWREQLLFGSRERTEILRAVPVRTEGGVFAIFAIAGTPLEGAGAAEELSAIVEIGDQAFAMREVGFLANAPDIAAVRIPTSLMEEKEKEAFAVAEDPLRFTEAVLVRKDEEAYGEIPTRIPPGEEGFLEVQNRLMTRLFGEFAPSTGDYVFSRSGAVIGIMVAGDRARILSDPRIGETRDLRIPESSEN